MSQNKLMQELQKSSTRHLLKRLIREYMAPYWTPFGVGVFCMILTAASTALLANQIEPIIDRVFVERNQDMLWIVSTQIFLIFVVKGISTYGQSLSMTKVGEGVVAGVRSKLIRHILRSDLAFFHNTPTGELISRLTSDVGMIHQIVSRIVTSIVKDSLTLIFLVTLMFYKDWFLSFCAFFLFPLAYYPIMKIGKKMRRSSGEVQQEVASLVARLSQLFTGIRLVKAYAMEDKESKRTQTIIEQIYHLTVKMIRSRAATHPIVETLGGVAIMTVILYGGWQVIHGNQTSGAFFSFITALLLVYEPIKRLANLSAELQERLASAVRVFEVLDTKHEIIDTPKAKPLKSAKGEITFDQVCFSYNEDEPVLDHVSLQIPQGKTVALVGPSGGGKSTIMNLIPRFYDIGSGSIKLDKHETRELTLESLRHHISLVSQEVTLFDETIADNISYGCEGATEEEIINAAKAAAAHDFITQLPAGYKTIVGEQGVRLSGGQRQRIAIARAILKNAPILLLDEATSALDTKSEQKIQHALETLMKDKTTLIIAHRLSTVQNADIIYVIQEGQVKASGTHQELLKTCSLYQGLCKSQLNHGEFS